jgi:hypothetical protein
MEKHIISGCSQVDRSVRDAIIHMVEARECEIALSGNSNKRKFENNQTTLEKFYENSELSKEKKEDIDIALVKAFVCCGLPWHLVENPFFIELFTQLRSNYKLPNRKTLADAMLTQEILRVSVKLYKLLDEEKNLTLGKSEFIKSFN